MSTYPVTIENAAPKKRRGTGRLAITVNVNNIDAQAERNSLCEMQAYLVHLLLEMDPKLLPDKRFLCWEQLSQTAL